MADGVLSINQTGGAESAAAGDIITREKFSDFGLSLDFKITPAAIRTSSSAISRKNSALMARVCDAC